MPSLEPYGGGLVGYCLVGSNVGGGPLGASGARDPLEFIPSIVRQLGFGGGDGRRYLPASCLALGMGGGYCLAASFGGGVTTGGKLGDAVAAALLLRGMVL